MSFKDEQDALIKNINNVFGETVIYTYSIDDTTSEISGVFDNAFVEINQSSTRRPILKNVRLADLNAEPVEGDKVSINSVEYTVRDHEPDSFGSTILILEKI